MTLSSTAVERAIARCTSRWAMARGHRLNTSIVLAAVYGLSGLFRAVSAVEPINLSSPSHSVPVPNRPSRHVDVKQHESQHLSIVLAAVHGLSPVFFGRFPRSSLSLSSPSHSVPVPNRPSRLRGR